MLEGAGITGIGTLRAVGEALYSEAGLLVVDQAGRLLTASATACDLLGLPDDAEGRAMGDLGADHRLLRVIESCAGGKAPAEREVVTAGRALIVRAVPVADGVVIVVSDQSRMRRVELMRRDFVANVSHELRTPLTAIRLLVETLQKGALHDAQAAPEFLHSIAGEVQHLSQMVEELLELSTIEAGDRELELAAVSVAGLLASAERLRGLAESRGVQLVVENSATGGDVLGDETRLVHVVRNLVHNAIKFSSPGGEVRLSASVDGADVEIRCRDDGCGIRLEDQSRIFERFWKADTSRRRESHGEGSGLGLAIARHIVEAHRGSISVDSTPGTGSTFIVRLASAPAQQPVS